MLIVVLSLTGTVGALLLKDSAELLTLPAAAGGNHGVR